MPPEEIGVNSTPYIDQYLLKMEHTISDSKVQLAVRTFREMATNDDKCNFPRALNYNQEPITRGAQGQAIGTVVAQAVGVVALGPAGEIGGKIGSYIQDTPPTNPPRF